MSLGFSGQALNQMADPRPLIAVMTRTSSGRSPRRKNVQPRIIAQASGMLLSCQLLAVAMPKRRDTRRYSGFARAADPATRIRRQIAR